LGQFGPLVWTLRVHCLTACPFRGAYEADETAEVNAFHVSTRASRLFHSFGNGSLVSMDQILLEIA